MTSKERVARTLEYKEVDRVPFGIMGTSPENEQRMARELGLSSVEDMYKQLGLDIWHLFTPLEYTGQSRTHIGLPCDYWGVPYEVRQHGNSGDVCPLKDIDTLAEVESYKWPSIKDFDTSLLEKQLESHKEFCIDGGLWAPIFHNVTWLCGFETTLVNLALKPEVSAAIIRHVTDFWIDYAKLTLETAKGRIDLMQNCNDFGAQQSLIMSHGMFEEFFRPELARLYDAIHGFDVKVIQHSCGAISPVIGDFVELGADILNPVQVSATGMEPAELVKKFGGKLAFYGGIDTQHVLPDGPESNIRQVTRQTLETFKDCAYILGPSQGIEEDIATAHVVAMFDEGRKYAKK